MKTRLFSTVVMVVVVCGCSSTTRSVSSDADIETDGAGDVAARSDLRSDLRDGAAGDVSPSSDVASDVTPSDSSPSDVSPSDVSPPDSDGSFIGDRQEAPCDYVYPVCVGKYAGCVLADDAYISGQFPGTRNFLVETTPSTSKIKLSLFLYNKSAPGTDFEVGWYEPGCSDLYTYQQSKVGGDLFSAAGADDILEVEQIMISVGDHLVEIYSDATCTYVLRAEAVAGP